MISVLKPRVKRMGESIEGLERRPKAKIIRLPVPERLSHLPGGNIWAGNASGNQVLRDAVLANQ